MNRARVVIRSLLIPAVLLAATLSAHAQYTVCGKIEYERKINVFAPIKEMGWTDWLDNIKATTPQFSITYFDLLFDTTRSMYKPGKEAEGNDSKPYLVGPAKENIVYTDFIANKVTANKVVYEQKFLVVDSIRRIDWTVKDEIRTISDFKCRKAVGRICDSVYVVAFYAEDIVVSGGPEMFGGLPGMILELAIPRLHTTWVADKVELVTPKDTDFVLPEKGKKVTEKELSETIQSSFKDWGKMSARYLWWTVL